MKLSLAAIGRAIASVLPAPAGASPMMEEPDVEDLEVWPIPAEAIAVHVTSEHAAVRLDAGRLSIAADGGAPTQVRLDDLGVLILHGNTSVSTPALLAVMRRGAPILWHGFDGRLVGQTLGLAGQPSVVREAQYTAAAAPDRALNLARPLVAAKIANSRRLLARRFGAGDGATRQLDALAARLPSANSLDRLRGLEGAAARDYLAAWPRMIDEARPHLTFAGRSRRPPADPINAAMSYLYAVLQGRCVAAAVAAGLDPMVGFLHERRAGRAALALDLMEPFRPLVVDAALIAACNNGELPLDAFETVGGACRLTAMGRRAALELFERRLAQTAAESRTRRRLTYRDALTRQARNLASSLRHGQPFAAFEPAR